MKKPRTSWTGFLSSAPYFTSAIMSAVRDEDLSQYPDLVRAVFYYDVFDGEVSNGGVMQYFFNQAFYLPDFETAAEIVSRHPVLAEGAAFMREVHTAWDSVKDQVAEARQSDEWPETLFSESTFRALEDRYFAANHAIRMKLYAAICAAPEDYLDIIPEDRDADYRFVDGFPVGPNRVGEGAREQTVWFTPDRMHVDVQSGGFFDDGSYTRDWVDFRTGASGSRRFQDGQLQTHQTQQALWYRHGLYESYDESGAATYTVLSLDGNELLTVLDNGDVIADKTRLKALLAKARDTEF